MMLPRRLLRAAGLLTAGLLLFLFFLYLFIPTERINSVINQQLQSQGLSLAPAAHKTLLPGLAWDNLLLSSDKGALLGCDRLRARLLLGPLLTGRVRLGATAKIRGGQLDLKYGVNGKEALALSAEGIDLADLPIFKTVLAAKAGGNLWSEGTLKRGPKGLSGEFKVEVKQLEFSGIKLGGFALPDASGMRTQGMLRVVDGNARLESFTLQGEGIYMRLSGDIPGGANAVNAPLNLSLEIMPKPEFLEKQKLVFMLLAKFMVSPGNYRVPIRGTVLNPVIL